MFEPFTMRGQSEPVGFLLIFGIVVLAIVLVGATGFTGLNQAQEFQRSANIERAFTLLATNIDDIVREGAPSRSTEIRIADASLSFETEETVITVTTENGSTRAVRVVSSPIVYKSGSGTTISYRNGALIREDDGSAVLLQEPRFVLTNEVVIIPVIETAATNDTAIAGTTAVSIHTRSKGSTLLASGIPVRNVTVSMTSPHAEEWVGYFEQSNGSGPVTNVTRIGDRVEVTIEPRRAYVTIHRLAVSFH